MHLQPLEKGKVLYGIRCKPRNVKEVGQLSLLQKKFSKGSPLWVSSKGPDLGTRNSTRNLGNGYLVLRNPGNSNTLPKPIVGIVNSDIGMPTPI